MTDIVERLVERHPDSWVVKETAEEIMRLRRENAQLGLECAAWRDANKNQQFHDVECAFNAPCRRYMGLLADIDELQREIERLRAQVNLRTTAEAWAKGDAEAADEIERLRAAIQELEGSSCDCPAIEQANEIERLRAALAAIIDEANDPAWSGSHCAQRMLVLARAALEDK